MNNNNNNNNNNNIIGERFEFFFNQINTLSMELIG
jgi:hypothetical protein